MFCLLIATGVVLSDEQKRNLHDDWSLLELEERVDSIQEELEQLAQYTPRGGIGTVGYRSNASSKPDDGGWIEIDFGEDQIVDELVLVPCLIRDPVRGYRVDGFPAGVRILDEDGELLASVAGEQTRAGIAPVVIPLLGKQMSKIRIEASEMTKRAFDGKYVFQLSEVLVFSGDKNVALRRSVDVSPKPLRVGLAWNPDYLTDGSFPYLMNSRRGESSVAYLSPAIGKLEKSVSLAIDLGEVETIREIRLHSIDQSDTVPQQGPSSIGMPAHLVVEGAFESDFSDAVEILEFKRNSSHGISQIMMWNISEVDCRFVRILSRDPHANDHLFFSPPMIGFAEIELLTKDGNVALGKELIADKHLLHPVRSISALTDGRNSYGEILSTRDWMMQLARRQKLERELPLVEIQLQSRYLRQKARLGWFKVIAVVLLLGIGLILLFNHLMRGREMKRVKERFAADLHDEIGAKVHGIGMLSDLAEKVKSSPEKLSRIHANIRSLTERLGQSVRYCTNLLEAEGLYTDIETDMLRMAERMMVTHEVKVEGREHLDKLNAQTMLDLLLFYKECLVNISRHAEATSFQVKLSITPKMINLVITDNGCGILNGTPASLKRRAKLIDGSVRSENIEPGGARVHLKLKVKPKHIK